MSNVRSRARGFGFAGLLVLAGVMLLLWNFGTLPDGYTDALWPLWPVLIVALGADLILSRVHPWIGSSVALLVVAGGLGAAWWAADTDAFVAETPYAEPIRVEAGGAGSARLDLTVALGELNLDAGTSGTALLEGALHSSSKEGALISSVRDLAGTRRISLSSALERRWWVPFGRSPGEMWELRLQKEIPTEIRIDGGAARLTLDLRELNVKLLDVHSGAAHIQVTLPESAGEIRATFDIGAASLEIEIPDGVAARIRTSTGVSAIDVDEQRFPRVGDGEYCSPDYDRAQNRADINVKAGASRVQIR